MVELKRINKFVSESGLCSRREVDRLVAKGLVLINGVKAEMGSKVSEEDVVLVNGKRVEVGRKKVYLAFNKPVGVTCTTDLRDPDNIIDYIGYTERIFPIGRLDKMSEGLIFLTNDGDIVNKILRAGNLHEKEYVVKVDRDVTEDFVRKMGSGVEILDSVTKDCFVERISKRTFRIVLTQGLNRQIRRMCEALGFRVLRLERVRIMGIELDGIGVGKWRVLSDDEMAGMLRDIEGSSGVAAARD